MTRVNPAEPLTTRVRRRHFWPGTTATAGGCRGGRNRAKPPIPTASGCRKSCCSRRPSPRSRPISWPSSSAGRSVGRSPPRRSTRCSAPGRGSAITPGRAICTPAPAPLPASSAAVSPKRGGIAGAARHRPLYGRGHRGHRFRPPRRGRRRQCRARHRPAGRHRNPVAAGQAAHPRARPRYGSGRPAGRFRPGAHGPGRDDLHAAAPACGCARGLAVAGASPRHRRGAAAQGPKRQRPTRHGAAYWIERATVRCSCAGGPTRVCSAA
jgi:hypothetical protein